MNEPKNNSFFSTIVFLCIATLLILAIILFTEERVPKQSSFLENPFTKII